MPIGAVSFFVSLLGLDIIFPCLLALLSCFSPQLVSHLLPFFSPSLGGFDFYHVNAV
jgi:hypothetical protein